MTERIARTSPESPAQARIDTHKIEPHPDESGQIWTILNTCTDNSQHRAAISVHFVRILPSVRHSVGEAKCGRADAVRYHRS